MNIMATSNIRDATSQDYRGCSTVIMLRHAQSQWNLENRFSGWADPPLTTDGIAEAEAAGRLLFESGIRFDIAYSSRQQRAVHTLDILLESLGQSGIPRYQDWRLNERHYGVLQGETSPPSQ